MNNANGFNRSSICLKSDRTYTVAAVVAIRHISREIIAIAYVSSKRGSQRKQMYY